MLDAGAKEEVSEWLRNGDGNSTIARALEEQFDGQSDTMTLETGETADYSVTENTFMLNLLDKSHTVRMYDLRTVAGVLRAMYQQELGGFSHESAQESPVHPTYTAKTEVVYPVEKNHLPFDVAVQTLHFDEPERKTPQNFHITDDNLGVGGAKAKYQMNMAAIKALHEIENENRPATPEEQATLSKYVGWGALADAFDKSKPAWSNEYKELQTILTPEEYASARASTLNAHYTCPTVIKAMYQALENMGFKGGNILEPSCGVGNFFGLLPESMAKSKLYGVELDDLPVGGYFLHEDRAPEGYTADEGYYYFKLAEDGERVEVTNTADKEAGFVNKKQSGSLRIIKVEKGTDKRLEGATFCVKDENGQVIAEGKTDKNGEIFFDDLPFGSYTYQEVYAPDGYKLDDTEYKFEIGGKTIEVEATVENEKTPATTTTVPKTGDTRPNPWLIGGIGLTMLAGAGCLIAYLFKKRRN